MQEKASERKLLWDEENRLMAINTNGFISGYWYDAAGERVVKVSGDDEGIYVNDVFSGGRTETANFTAYVNPYLVVGKGGQYTKHIYIGSQRIVSKLGDLDSYGQDPRRVEYAGTGVDGAKVDYKAKYKQSQQSIKDYYAHFEVPYYGKDNDDYVNGSGFCCDESPATRSFDPGKNDNPELFQYYYHSDHLGSSSLITNLDGEIVQHVEYVPFGEVFIEERNNRWNTPYLFNAKELDEETGLYYYGARYYEPRISLWLSTDPIAEKYPNISAYVYTVNNPIKYIDPDGEDIVIAGKNNSSIIITTDLIDVSVNAGSLLGDLGGNYNLAGQDILIAALDIVGIFDPTGIADVAAATFEAEQGNWGSALLSGLGVIPYVGDIGKVAKIGKHVNTVERAIEAAKALDKSLNARKTARFVHGNSKASTKAQHGYEIFDKTTGEVLEYGISGQKRSSKQILNGESPRINQKLKQKYNNDSNVGGRVVNDDIGNRQQGLNWEQNKVDNFTSGNGGNAPQRQILPKPKNK